MRRVTSVLILATALLLGSFTLTTASADNNDRDDFWLLAVSNQSADIDVGAEGESIGDYFVFSDDLHKQGRLVGTLEGQCTATRIDEDTGAFHQQCLVTAVLPQGQLTVQGVIVFEADTDRARLAITGGTGRYDDAAGQVHVRFLSDTETRIRVDLED